MRMARLLWGTVFALVMLICHHGTATAQTYACGFCDGSLGFTASGTNAFIFNRRKLEEANAAPRFPQP